MPAAASLRVGGLSPHSSCDWPGQLVATVFAQGCPWACAYCHNPHLLPARGSDEIAWEEVLAFLRTRRGLLDGVVFTGGEPTLQEALPAPSLTCARSASRSGCTPAASSRSGSRACCRRSTGSAST